LETRRWNGTKSAFADSPARHPCSGRFGARAPIAKGRRRTGDRDRVREIERIERKGEAMANAVRPFLMFEGSAEEAMRFYVALIPGSEITSLQRYGPGGPGAEGSVMRATFRIGDQTVMCIDSPVKHAFTFTPSVSLFVECESDEEIERFHAALADGGTELMELANYGFSRRFAWLNDRFGVSWQLNLA
jgi:predicted 3-demethylubiquinone-9 3-methyltransferase (glyoxalase superfamily)